MRYLSWDGRACCSEIFDVFELGWDGIAALRSVSPCLTWSKHASRCPAWQLMACCAEASWPCLSRPKARKGQ
jgi:hypothetical protein